jgi:hypothetical protein
VTASTSDLKDVTQASGTPIDDSISNCIRMPIAFTMTADVGNSDNEESQECWEKDSNNSNDNCGSPALELDKLIQGRIEAELQDYIDGRPVDNKKSLHNPLNYWPAKRDKYPVLFSMALDYLCCQGNLLI